MIDEADERAIEKVARAEPRRAAPAMRPARRSNAIVASAQTAKTASTPAMAGTSAAIRSMYCVRSIAALRDERGRGDHGVEERRDRHVLPVGRGVGIDGDAMRKVPDLALGKTHVIPRVGLEKIHALPNRRRHPTAPRRAGRRPPAG